MPESTSHPDASVGDQVVSRDRVPAADGTGTESGLEVPDADAREQHTPVDVDDQTGTAGGYPATFDMREVDAADAADQERAVEFDEDDYR